MYAASRRKQTPTILSARLSFSSRRCTCASTDILHSKTDPEVTSMKLSIPKPRGEMLPAIAPATTATRPSQAFHALVKYSSLRPCRTTAVRSKMAVSAIPAVYNVARPSLGSACREFGLASWAMNNKDWEIEFIRRRLMHRSCLLIPVLLLIAAPVFGQSTSTDSQTLQALLAEVRQLRHDLQTTTLAAQRAQSLLYRLQGKEAAVARASQRVEDVRGRLAETASSRQKLAIDIKQHEDFIGNAENPARDRKEVEDVLPRLKESLQSMENEEQQRQTRAIEAEDQLRAERAKLSELQDQLDQLEKVLEGSGRQAGT